VSQIARRLVTLGLELPAPLTPPPGVVLPFSPVVLSGERAIVSGHGPQNADGSLAGPFGKVGADVTPEQAHESARLVALSILGSLERALGDLDRITAFTRVFGMVNAAPGFTALPGVVNGFSNVILDVFGPDVGAHARSAVGLAELPFSIPVEIECEVTIR
jgi:enamine deaminase RidA (YjgF/YER057c/UK114 family)